MSGACLPSSEDLLASFVGKETHKCNPLGSVSKPHHDRVPQPSRASECGHKGGFGRTVVFGSHTSQDIPLLA